MVGVGVGVAAGPDEVVPGDGIATHYDSVDGGNCSFPGPPADHLDAALSHVEYGTADACGGYLDVVGPQGQVRVLITNHCPECPVGHVDLSKPAFERIAPLVEGRVPVSYTLVRNPPVAQPIALRVKSGSSRWWLQIQAIDHGNPIAAFELQTSSGWRSLVHTSDNFWMAENPGPGDGPFTVRITDIHGQSVTIDDVALTPDQVQRTSARLYDAGAPPPPPTTTPATTEPPATTAPTTTVTTAPPTSPVATAAPVPSDGADDEAAIAAASSSSASSDDDGGSGVGPASILLAAVTFAALAALTYALRRRPGEPERAAATDDSGQPPVSAPQPASNSST